MGEVYLAGATRLDRQVAIKALPAHLAQDPDRLARFHREAKILALLNHPDIGAIYGLEEANGHQYLILEFVEGETLADRLAEGPIPMDEALTLAKQVADDTEADRPRRNCDRLPRKCEEQSRMKYQAASSSRTGSPRFHLSIQHHNTKG